MSKSTNAERFRILDSLRISKLERARYCSSLTIPSILPPEDWNEQSQLPQPYSSIAARGVTAMSSRMLSALLPLNDSPFFRFELSSGMEAEVEIESFLSNLSFQVYNKLSSGNLRDSIYQILQHLIIVGDVMVIIDDDMNLRIIRIDRFVARRDVYGEVEEVIYKEYEIITEETDDMDVLYSSSLDMDNKQGYKPLWTRLTKNNKDEWISQTQDKEGVVVNSGKFSVPNFIILRWTGIPGENYGRSHCEDLIGDIKALEGFTEGLINGISAASIFWMAVDPTGMAEVDDINGTPTGGWIAARPNEVHVVSPATTMNPQIGHTQQGVEILRREIGRAFLLDSASIPEGERVTATAVRMIGQELEHVLGGAFSAIARELMRPLVSRVLFLMISDGEVDERLEEMFSSEEGLLNVEIVTGLQALSRDSDLQKLMQMGEMVRNLPEPAAAMFRWDQYGKALITSLGFNSEIWIKSEEQVREEQMKIAQAQAQMQSAQQNELMMNQAVTGAVAQAAQQDIEQTGGAGIQQAMQQMQQQGAV
tara:strand:- start:862 stop:2469 length:1608 start_codon:yes stop_codon:yes gene_type:complete